MTTRALLAATLVALAAGRADAALLINEIAYNPPGTDSPNEYIELRNTDATALTIPAGTYLVGIEGDTSTTGAGIGDVQTTFDVSGLVVPANGFLVLRQAGSTLTAAAGATVVTGTTNWTGVPGYGSDTADIESVSASFLLIQSATAPLLTDDIDSDNDGNGDGVYLTWTVLDSIGVLDSGANDRSYAAVTFVRTGGGTGGTVVPITFEAGYVGRIGNSTGSTANDWVAAELVGVPPAITLSTTVDMGTGVVRTSPAALAGEPLDHVGAENPSLPTAMNTAPVITVAASAVTIAEDTIHVFSAATANAITVADADAGAGLLAVTLTATSPGIVTVDTAPAITFTGGMNGSSTVTFTGTVANVNTALDGLSYFASPDVNGTTTLQISVDDLGNTGAGGPLTDSETITFTITAVNDAPTVGVPPAQMVQVNGLLPFSTATGNGITIADPDGDVGPITVTVGGPLGTVTVTAAGSATTMNNGSGVVTITGSLADVNATLETLVFTAPATAGSATMVVTASDGTADGQGTIAIAVTGAPFLNAPAGPFTFTTALGGASAPQSLLVMAGSLAGPITVTTVAPFTVATMAAGPYGLTTMLPATGGMVYVRYEPATGAEHTGTIVYTATGVASPAPTALTGIVFRITTGSLPEAVEGVAFMATAMAAGGNAPVTWSLQAGAPAWLGITSTGTLSGTPTEDGTVSVTIVATDATNQTTSATFQLIVVAGTPPDSPVADAPDAPADAIGVDARPDGGGGNPVEDGDDDGGCCGTSRPGPAWFLSAGVLALLVRRRRRATL